MKKQKEMDCNINLLKEFKKEFILFIDELIDQYPEYPDFVIARIAITNQVPFEYVVKFLLDKIAPFPAEIESRNDIFFLNKTDIFEDFDRERVEACKNIWRSFDKENKQIIWEWIDLFVKLAKRCVV
jgi:hypothetical protein